MNNSNCIERNVISIPSTSTIREVAPVFVKTLVGLFLISGDPIPTTDDKLKGMASQVDTGTAILSDCSKVEER